MKMNTVYATPDADVNISWTDNNGNLLELDYFDVSRYDNNDIYFIDGSQKRGDSIYRFSTIFCIMNLGNMDRILVNGKRRRNVNSEIIESRDGCEGLSESDVATVISARRVLLDNSLWQ